MHGRSQRYFAHVTTVSLSWRVQNIVVISPVYSKLERSGFSSNFEFDRNMFSGTGASICYISIQLRWELLKCPSVCHSTKMIPRSGHCCVLFCFSINRFYPYPSKLLHRLWSSHSISPGPAKKFRRTWINKSLSSQRTTTWPKQSKLR